MGGEGVMNTESTDALPNRQSWRFDEIAEMDPARAATLESAGSPDELIAAIRVALQDGLAGTSVRLGFERAEGRNHNCRAVIQFAVGEGLFDWFFNARTGYRAHFRVAPARGLAFNGRVIGSLALILARRLPDPVQCTDLSEKFEDCGRINISRNEFLASLATDAPLSKVWFCSQRIGRQGGIERLPLGVGGPKIVLDGTSPPWAAPARDDGEAWLEVKGAFVGTDAPFQPKDPMCRARRLSTRAFSDQIASYPAAVK